MHSINILINTLINTWQNEMDENKMGILKYEN